MYRFVTGGFYYDFSALIILFRCCCTVIVKHDLLRDGYNDAITNIYIYGINDVRA